MSRETALKMGVLLAAVVVACGIAEIVVRALGYRRYTEAWVSRNEPTMHEPDPILGWRHKPGHYLVAPYALGSDVIEITLLPNGSRRTGANDGNRPDRDFLLIGDSFTMGWAIDDNETYAWKLQSRFPSVRFVNYGTAGYGTYQSLLLLERELAHSRKPKGVVYGFVDFHEERNVVSYAWLRDIVGYERRNQVEVPYVTFDPRRGLERHSADHYLSLPFRGTFALVPLIEGAYMQLKTFRRSLQKRVVTEQILLEMQRLSARNRVSFAVALLYISDPANKPHYLNFLGHSGIPAIDCAIEIPDELRVRGEGHPNGVIHSRWTECLSHGLTKIAPLALAH